MEREAIDQVRRFNRLVSQRIGALDDDFLARGRPLSEARLLHEIGSRHSNLSELREQLGLDSGYFARLLRSLESQELVETRAAPQDARARTLHLTARGEEEFAAYEGLSDAAADNLLQSLSETQQNRLTTAMAEVERLLRAAKISIALEDPRSADAAFCLGEYYAELDRRFDSGFVPDPDAPEEEYRQTTFLVARLKNNPVGCGMLRPLDHDIGEIKRVWTAASVRGLGVASRIMDRLESAARDQGCKRVRLDTNGTLKEAQAMYRKRGYREIPRYNDNPFAQHWFEKTL